MDVPQIDSQGLADDAVILDVREQDEWDAGHAPRAVHIPLGDLPSRLDEVPLSDDGPLAVVCRGGGRSARAVGWLVQQGFDVANLDGGMKAWQASGRPLASERPGTPTVV